jgi:hypothetical protein
MTTPKAMRKKTREAISTGSKRRPKNAPRATGDGSLIWLVAGECAGLD